MSLTVEFSVEAQAHLNELEDYLAERFYPGNARKYLDRLMQSCLSLGRSPHRGRSRDDLRPGLRVIGFERRVSIYFKVVGDRVYIVGVLYGGRELI